jgi:apolipoprotein N-acyltransferase
MAMPILRTVEFAEDYSADLPLALALILILGPFVGAILYGFICMARQGEWTSGVVGVFVSYLVLRIALDATAGIKFETLFPWNELSMQTISAQLMPIATIVGWFAAFPFHQPDES